MPSSANLTKLSKKMALIIFPGTSNKDTINAQRYDG